MLKRIVIEHYRSCLKTSFDCHPRLSVLIGPNSSGKTNVLQAMMLLNKMSQHDEYGRGRPDSATLTARLRATFDVGTNSAHINALVAGFTDDSNNDVLVDAQQKWTLLNKRGTRISTKLPFSWRMFPDEMWRRQIQAHYHWQSYRPLYNDMKQQPWGRRTIEKVIRFCYGMRYYGASQFTNPGACPVSFEIEKEGEHRRPWRLKGHARTLYDLYIAQKSPSRTKYDQFIDIIGSNGLGLVDKIAFREISTSSTEYSVRVGGKLEKRRAEKVLVIPQFKHGKAVLSPNQLSEGTFKTLALLFYIITGESTALLIEEPEVCVHQGLLSSIMELVKKYSTEKQMIVSTHSDYVLDQVKPENVFTVRAYPANGTVVRHIKKTMNRKEYEALRFYL